MKLKAGVSATQLALRVATFVCLFGMALATYLDRSWSRPAWWALLALGSLFLLAFSIVQRGDRRRQAGQDRSD